MSDIRIRSENPFPIRTRPAARNLTGHAKNISREVIRDAQPFSEREREEKDDFVPGRVFTCIPVRRRKAISEGVTVNGNKGRKAETVTETGSAAISWNHLRTSSRPMRRKRTAEDFLRFITACLGAASLVITVLICIAAFLAGSPFGMFISEESEEERLKEVIIGLDKELLGRITEIRDSSGCGVYIVRGHPSSWKDVLSVYSVMVTSGKGLRYGPSEMTQDNIRILSKLHSDMNRITFSVSGSGTDAEEDDVLIIDLTDMSAEDAADNYGFTDDQKELMREIMSFGSGLWDRMSGGYSSGMGFIPSAVSRKSLGIFGWPLSVNGIITSDFGYRNDPFSGAASFHGGTDIAAPSGTPVLSAADGRVIVSNGSDSWGGGYGYHVMIEHEGGFVTVYGHCSFVCVTQGQEVRKGEMIAGVGTTGNSTGDHLHFEIRENGVKTDPMQWFGT